MDGNSEEMPFLQSSFKSSEEKLMNLLLINARNLECDIEEEKLKTSCKKIKKSSWVIFRGAKRLRPLNKRIMGITIHKQKITILNESELRVDIQISIKKGEVYNI